MLDYFEQPLNVGDRVAFVARSGYLTSAYITGFRGVEGYTFALLHTDGNRRTEARCNNLVRQP